MTPATTSREKPPKGQATRARILVRAATAFRDLGFHDATMRDIAAAAGMHVGNLYYHFPAGKSDLLYECQRTALKLLLDGARRIEAGSGTAPEKLRALVALHIHCLLVETGGSAAHLEFRALPPARRATIARGRRAYEAVFRRTLARGAKAGELRAVDAKLAALALLGALNGIVTWWRPEGDRSPEAIATSYADTLVGGLLP